MKEREELELILKLIRKYNLPLSPILEYAINEKIEEFPEIIEDVIIEDDEVIEEVNDSICNVESTPLQGDDNSLEKTEQINSSENLIQSQNYVFGSQSNHCYIDDKNGKRLFSSSGRILLLGDKFYRISYTYSFLSINLIIEDDRNLFVLGRRVVNAQYRSPLYKCLDEKKYLEQIKDIKKESNSNEYFIKVGSQWYESTGYPVDLYEYKIIDNLSEEKSTKDTKDYDVEQTISYNLKIVDYSESSIVVIGDTKPFKETLKAMGGYFSTKFLCGTGWMFNKNKRNEVENFINKVTHGSLTKEQTYDTLEEDSSKNTDLSEFSVKIGDTLKLFPSQFVGEVIKLRVDKKGHRKILVKSDNGQIVETYDDNYLYQKIYKNANKTQTPKINDTPRYVSDTLLTIPTKRTMVKVGNWIHWKPTGDVGKVIGFKNVGSVQKIVIRMKSGSELEVYDNPRAYEIIMR